MDANELRTDKQPAMNVSVIARYFDVIDNLIKENLAKNKDCKQVNLHIGADAGLGSFVISTSVEQRKIIVRGIAAYYLQNNFDVYYEEYTFSGKTFTNLRIKW